jgi:hypothetical protein
MRPRVPVDGLDGCAAPEQNQSRRHPHTVVHGGLLRLVRIDLNHLQVTRKIVRELLEMWLKLTARPTAWGEEFDQNRDTRLPDFLVERRVICMVQHDAECTTKKALFRGGFLNSHGALLPVGFLCAAGALSELGFLSINGSLRSPGLFSRFDSLL